MEKENDLKYLRAKDAVKCIQNFYWHLAIYLSVILLAIVAPFLNFTFCFICFSDNHWINLLGFAPWGIGLLIHGLVAFRSFKPFHRWEERKLREFMDEEG
jgi:hypothetical protein